MSDQWTKICLTGAGSFRFSMGFLRDVIKAQSMHPVELILHDINVPVLRDISRTCRRWIKKNNLEGKIKVTESINREESYENVDYHIIVIAVGGQTSELSDIFTTLRVLHLPYNTGDTCGVPGVMRAMREIPHIVAMSKDIEKYSRCRIALNYSNPMAFLSWASQKYAPRANLVGICHELWGGLAALGEEFGEKYGIKNMIQAVYPETNGIQQMEKARVVVKYGGLNHFSWIYEMKIDGEDVLPRIDCDAKMQKAGGDRMVNYFLLKKYGGFPVASARHNVEFMSKEDLPEYWDPLIEIARKNPEEETFRKACPTGPFKIMPLRNVRHMHTDHVSSIIQMRLQGLGLFPLPELGGSGERALAIFQNDHLNQKYVTVGNLANLRPDGKKIVPNLPDKTALEVDWWVDKGKVITADWGPMPQPIADLVAKNCKNVDFVVETALKCDRDMLVNAIQGEPSCYHLKRSEIEKCVDVLLHEQRPWLPEGWFK